jgi:hypothetical protein
LGVVFESAGSAIPFEIAETGVPAPAKSPPQDLGSADGLAMNFSRPKISDNCIQVLVELFTTARG